MSMKKEIRNHLLYDLIPFWEKLKDEEFGGFYGYVDFGGAIEKTYEKGCILNSRIIWFFSNACLALEDPSLLDYARHGYEFLKNHFYDREFGGVYWSLNYDGTVKDSMKHTYNQVFAIYGLSSYYLASGDKEALSLAFEIFNTVESKCKDEYGYMEEFTREFHVSRNDALSENGVMAEKTMNTLLHVAEGYTELYRASKNSVVKEKLEKILRIIADKIYNREKKHQEVFFDKAYNSLIDLYSYGHDIETSWLIDKTVKVLDEDEYKKLIYPITEEMCHQVYITAFDGHSLANECDKGYIDENRIWWVQAETVLGFLNQYEKTGSPDYLIAAKKVWIFIKNHIIDTRPDGTGEWFYCVNKSGNVEKPLPLAEPWKCPYHNGRMCFEIMKKDYL